MRRRAPLAALWLLAASWLYGAEPAPPAVTVVNLPDGVPAVSANATLLRRDLSAVLGRPLPAAAAGTPTIALVQPGPELAGQLDAEGYAFVVADGRIELVANPPSSDSGDPRVWVQASFARRFLGVDQYFPGELGQVAPPVTSLSIPAGVYVENPAFKARHWSGYAGSAGPAWRVRASGGGGRYRFHHNLARIIDPALYGADHPDWFPAIAPRLLKLPLYSGLQPGERFVPPARQTAYWQPCTTNPGVLRTTVETIVRYFDEHPAEHSFSLGINDSGGFCQCPGCLAEFPAGVAPDSAAANGSRMYRFYNAVAEQVAEKHPRVTLGFLVYADLADYYPEQLHPSLMPYLTLSFADCWDAAYRDQLYARIDRWSKLASRFGIYEYYYGQGFLVPRIYLHAFADGLRYAHQRGATGFYAEAYPNWGLDGPKLWVTEKLLWNPGEDVDALLDTWCRGLFGAAADPMRSYFAFLEDVWMQQRPGDARRGGYRLYGAQYKGQQFAEIFPPAICDRAWALLDQALAVAPDELTARRIAYFRDSFGATRLASARYHAAGEVAALAPTSGKPLALSGPLLAAVDQWASYPPLPAYLREIQPRAPHAFQEFSVEALAGKPASFAVWDTDLPVLTPLALALLATADGLTQPDIRRQLAAGLAPWAAQYSRATELIQRLAERAVLTATPLANAPTIDGRLEPAEWGEPQLDGPFTHYPFQLESSPETTRLWIARHGDLLYLAVHCLQPPGTIIPGPVERDYGLILDDRGGVKPGDGVRDFPYLYRVDAVGISFPSRAVAIVTAGGGIFDGLNASGPYRPAAWDGVRAAVSQNADGWTAELAIDLPDDLRRQLLDAGRIHLNLFRVRGDHRSAWVPAMPRVWSLEPRTAGLLLCPSETPSRDPLP